jgi:hypothetical protein
MCEKHSLPVGNYGNGNWCVQCKREYDARWYQSNKSKRRDWNKRHLASVRDRINEYKSSTPCLDCGKRFPPYVMDFDHVTGTKSENIAYLASAGLTNRLQEELKKCVLVCSNCHRERTHQRRRSAMVT